MSAGESVYRFMLRAYPSEFRAAYAREMSLAFRDLRRETDVGRIRFWAELIWDVAQSAPVERVDAMCARWRCSIHTGRATMKPMAIVAVLIGTLELVNALIEGLAGGFATSPVGATLAAIAGVLLVVAGIGLLRGSSRATIWPRSAVIVCLVLFVIASTYHSQLSIFSRLLGIGYTLAFLIYLTGTRGSGPKTAVS